MPASFTVIFNQTRPAYLSIYALVFPLHMESRIFLHISLLSIAN